MSTLTRSLAAALLLSLLAAAAGPAGAADAPKKPPFEVKVVGKGRPMILIPGLMSAGAVWDSTVEHYKDRYECHVLTLAGFAGQPPVPGPFLESVRRGLADYIRARKLDKPVVVGHSLGGYLVFALGASDPDLVGPLVAVDGLPCMPAVYNEKIDAEGIKKQGEQARGQMEKMPREQFLAQTKGIFKTWIRDAKQREAAEKWADESDQATVARAVGELLGTDLRPQLDRIKAPVLLLGAWTKGKAAYGLKREDVQKRYEDQVARVPRHKVAVAEDADHFIMYDAPDWMFAQIDAFLAEK
jgi:pimeloyl-ACP methyl ester carboxylesterase